jgi:hypothetical protein
LGGEENRWINFGEGDKTTPKEEEGAGWAVPSLANPKEMLGRWAMRTVTFRSPYLTTFLNQK